MRTVPHDEDHPPVPQTIGARWLSMPGAAQVVFIGAAFAAVCATGFLVIAARKFPDVFMITNMFAGQIFGFIVCLTAIFAWIGVRFVLDEATRRRALTDDGESQLSGAAEFAAYMVLFFVCDRTTLLPRESKKYDPDTFWFLWFSLVGASLLTLRKAKPPKPKPVAAAAPQTPVTESASDAQGAAATGDGAAAAAGAAVVAVSAAAPQSPPPEVFHVAHLQRDQTEEWKGWMQVMFLWYHYFNATPIYNAIRLYIAAYVWMTGFGNFSFYYMRRDFSLARFCQMQWRLNFMVVFTCAVLANEYMLYYICMLHTTFTVIIYASLGVAPHLNSTAAGVAFKFGLLAFGCFLMWDTPTWVFDTVWWPLKWLVQFHDPYRPALSVMHEWQFRSFLDHYIWIVGMLCAFNHPRIDAWLQRVDSMPQRSANTIKLGLGALILGGWWLYGTTIFSLSKFEYNKLHPYTSWIPILLYIALRNISQRARMYHLHLFEFLGKTTLETYIAQFHIWMATTGVNGSPKKLLRVIPAGWPLLNFAVVSIVFCFVSYRLFTVTGTTRGIVLPFKASNETLRRNIVVTATVLGAAFAIALVMEMMLAR